MTTALFITATDTDAGKTLVASGILMAAKLANKSTLGFKPVSAGCHMTPEGLRNDDALILQQACTEALSYDQVNPIAYADPVAPHLAAAKAGQTIELSQLHAAYRALIEKRSDLLLVEGAGGWRLPLGQGAFMSDFVKQHHIDVVLVVGLKLGCLNHALLTLEALKQDKVNVVGWVANQIDPEMDYLQQNIDALVELLDAPCMGIVPHLVDKEQAYKYINMDILKPT